MDDITRILNNFCEGKQGAEEAVLALYNELRALAREKMSREPSGHTLQPTALVHEVWLRLILPSRSKWQNRAHFFAAASEAMRRILVDHARRKQRLKRGGGMQHEEIGENTIVLSVPPQEILAVDEAVEELEKQDAQVAELVKLRYFVGMTMVEAASAMGLAPRTAERLWTFGRAWLRNHVRRGLTLSELDEAAIEQSPPRLAGPAGTTREP
jgi:RNA polymerase sigma factor (TIGR02999 family)